MLALLVLFFCFDGMAQGTGQPNLAAEPTAQKQDDSRPDESLSRANSLLEKRDKFKTLESQADVDIRRHKPIFFAYGKPLTKVQFSFKSPIVEDVPFFFGYSQLIFWKLHEDSKPFLDATYNPEFFYRLKWPESRKYAIDLGVWEHSSNGRDGADSRSYDQSYLRLNYFIESANWIFVIAGKFRFIYNVDDTNRDILDYMGPAEFEFRIIQLFSGWIDKSEFVVNFNPGGKFSDRFDKGGLQLGYNFRLGGLKVVPSFYLQYYGGFGETLINYDQRVQAFRAGLVF